MLERNHYIQNRLLKNFAIKAENGKEKICILDLINFSVDIRNTESVFYERNLYDVNSCEDVKELEKKFNDLIEKPMVALFDKICNSTNTVTFNRKELKTIKKYFLLQHYRTPKNKRSYTNNNNGKFKLSQYNIAEGETEEDFWKREMLTILESDWYDLMNSNLVGVKKHTMDVNASFVMILKTNNEFCINDIGYVTERLPLQISKDREKDYIKNVKELGKQLYGKGNFDEAAKYEIDKQSSYIDNFALYPISSNYAVLFVSPIWKCAYFYPQLIQELSLFSPILQKYLIFPQNEYVNGSKIHNDADIPKYMDEQDKFIYTTQSITEDDTIYLNNLIMNEAYCFVGVKTPAAFIPSIRRYNLLASNGIQNIHHNFNGYVDLLSKIAFK